METRDTMKEGLRSMRQPSLIKQLRSVLDQYPKGQILKEMIQNAEDAGAREVKVLYEGRQCNRPEDLVNLDYAPHVKALQGPGLCVFNDAKFTEKDWDGIQMIQCSNKEHDRLKVGRYGLGFKSVFHITDWVCILSGEWILFINPHQPKDEVCLLKKLDKLDQNTKDAVSSLFGGTFGFSQACLRNGTYDGTLFWFPLRQIKSELSEDVYAKRDIMNLFKDFMAEAEMTLLFLKSLESISLFKTRRSSPTAQAIFSVKIGHQYVEAVHLERMQFKSHLDSIGNKLPSKSYQSISHFSVECTKFNVRHHPKITSQDWIVVNFYKGGSMSDQLRHLCADSDLSYSPYVGVAYPLTNIDHFKGHIFCFLPLRSKSTTGLPVHVNGYFALTQDRREVKWSEDDGKQDQWNCCLISEVIPEAYIILVEELKKYCQTNNNSSEVIELFYRSFPDYRKVTDHWNISLDPFYKKLFQMAAFFSKVNRGTWIHWNCVILPDAESKTDIYETVTKTYLEYQQNIVVLPDHIVEKKKEEVASVCPDRLCQLLKTSDRYKNYAPAERFHLLKYVLRSSSHTNLEGLALLPVADGTFKTFSKSPVFFCPGKVNLFPGLENILVCEHLDSFIKQNLANMAKEGMRLENILVCEHLDSFIKQNLANMAKEGDCNLREVTAETFPRLVRACFRQNFANVGPPVLQKVSSKLGEQWLTDLWSCASKLGVDMQFSLSELPLVPEYSEHTIKLHPLINHFMVESFTGFDTLPAEISQSMQKLGVVVLPHVPDYIQDVLPVGVDIQFPSAQGVNKVLSGHISKEKIEHFNRSAEDSVKEIFVEYLASGKEIIPDAKETLKHLKLFKNTECSQRSTSITELDKMAPKEKIPVAYPSLYLTSESNPSRGIAIQLGAKEISMIQLICEVLDIMASSNQKQYNSNNIKNFVLYLFKYSDLYLTIKAIKQKASKIRFVPSCTKNTLCKANELFDPRIPFLKNLFYGEDVFPSKTYCESNFLNGLKKLGLKDEQKVTLKDVRNSAMVTESILGKTDEQNRVITKARYIWKACEKRNISDIKSTELMSSRWIPVLKKRPSAYPKHLPFAGENECPIGRPQDMCHFTHLSLVGSIRTVTNDTVPNEFASLFQSPPEEVVLDHFENIINSYTADEHPKYIAQLDDVYTYFRNSQLSSEGQIKLTAMKVVWAGENAEFVQAEKVWIDQLPSDVDLTPYRFPIPKSLKHFSDLFCQNGAPINQTVKMLLDVLTEIQQKYENWADQQSVSHDFNLVITILDALKTRSCIDKKKILIPVHNKDDRLILKQVEVCVYCESYQMSDDADKKGYESEDVYFANISSDLAKDLGVRILTNPLMDATEEIDMNFGQTEPLTRRLRNLLWEYTDGFSVPKEIIQNADDAGASEVNFLYDERENINARTNLINPGMSSLQGQALWAQNDAQFSKSDFDNITKLSGETKMDDATKIGRFGLGFNSVYNLTDVPSFISGNNVVIFDPHESYLGSAGMKADLTKQKNKSMLCKMKDQFEPFQGVFGCDLLQRDSQTMYAGTLFRFPLRTKLQAQQSQISDLCYSSSEMKRFLEIFISNAGNLLLFCQNVKTVRMYHLRKRVSDPSKATLLVEVRKNVDCNSKIDSGSVLKYFTNVWKKKCPEKNIGTCDIVNEHISIMLSVFDAASKVCNISSENSQVKWIVAWVLGWRESAQMALTVKLRGLLPVAAAAVPVFKIQGHDVLGPVSDCPEGFYKEGHLFCFLPIPIKSCVQLHINAAFALTHDRKHLCSRSEDEKSESTEAKWNEVLLSDAVPSAVICVLEDLKRIGDVDAEIFYKLWPKSEMQWGILFRRFYEFVVIERPVLFVYNGMWVDFENTLVLDPQLRFADNVGESAFKAFEYYYKGQLTVIDLPREIIKCFVDAGFEKELKSHVWCTEKFYEELFFPKVSDSYWRKKNRDRDCLVIFAIKFAFKYNNAKMKTVLKKTRCIPTRPYGRLKQPKELVHPSGKTSCLFRDSDEVFPLIYTNGFCASNILSFLGDLGMQNKELYWSVVPERVQSINGLYEESSEAAIERCRLILQYLEEKVQQNVHVHLVNRFKNCPNPIKDQMKCEKFLPIKQKPLNWPTVWHSTEDKAKLGSPQLMCFPECIHIVCSNKLILDSKSLDVTLTRKVLEWFGVRSKVDIPVSDVVEHLLTISVTKREELKTSALEKLASTCSDVYTHLNKVCLSKNKNEKAIILEKLYNNPVILQGKTFIRSEQIAFTCNVDCNALKPYLYKVDERAQKQYGIFLQSVGVKKTFKPTDAVNVMIKLSQNCGKKPLSKTELNCCEKAASLLVQLIEKTTTWTNRKPGYVGEMFKSLYLPDNRRILHPFSELCLDDCEWLQSSSVKFLHRCMSGKVAYAFGIRTRRQEDLKSHSVPFVQEFGQSEALTNRLNRILDGYPCDSSLMKELLQNADDAWASELMFIKDFRTHPCERIFDDRWKPLQGPALCVYNNSYFKQKDLEGIQNLGCGSKAGDPLKTGQYGVGFNAVYHLTDVPTFLTMGPETEETLCILDPNCLYTPTARPGIPGARFNGILQMRKSYKDIFSCFLEDKIPLQPQGTLFRFPLRTEEMARHSSISKRMMSTRNIEELLESFTADMAESLLFLHNIKKITVASIQKNGDKQVEHVVKTSTDPENVKKIHQHFNNLCEKVKQARTENMDLRQLDEEKVSVNLKIIITNKEKKKKKKQREQEWLVVHQFGFAANYDLPEEIDSAWKRKEIKLLPRGGVALRLDKPFEQCDKKVFCMLSLPIETGLPVHVNGHFALDHEARRNLWHGASDLRCVWNEHIVKTLIVPAYLTAIQNAQALCLNDQTPSSIHHCLKKYNSLFPDTKKVKEEFWNTLVFSLYKELTQNELKVFAVITNTPSVKWVSVCVSTGFPGFFSNLDSYFLESNTHIPSDSPNSSKVMSDCTNENETLPPGVKLVSLLKDINMKVIDAPLWIYENFCAAGVADKVQCVTPKNVIRFLKSCKSENESDGCYLGEMPQQVKNTSFQNAETVKFLITFCQKDETFNSEIVGLPLCLSNSCHLDVFNTENPILVTKFCDVIKGSPDKCLHKDIASLFEQFAKSCPALKEMTINDLSTLLPDTLDQDVFRSDSAVMWNDGDTNLPTKKWIIRFWMFLYDQLHIQNNLSLEDFGELKEWTLLPCKVTMKNTKEATDTYQNELYPIKKAKCIVNLQNPPSVKLQKAMKTLALPFFDSEFLSDDVSSFASRLVANWENIHNMLIALSSHTYGKNYPSVKNGRTLLKYIYDNLKDNINTYLDIEMLRKLPFFGTLFESTLPLVDCDQPLFVESQWSIPREGLKAWSLETNTTLFQSQNSLKNLYSLMNITVLTAHDFYTGWLLPRFRHLPKTAICIHLQYIKDTLLSSEYLCEQKMDKEKLITLLKGLPFIEKRDGTYSKASEFFSNKNKVFIMFKQTEFPPEPYNENEWHDFLVQAGMVKNVSVPLFIQFAETVELEGRECITEQVKAMSETLVWYLKYSRHYVLEKNLLTKVKMIRFVIPYCVETQEEQGTEMTSIYPQYERAKTLVAFGNSLSSEHCCVGWSNCTMYAKENKDSFLELNKNGSIPTKDVFILHMKNITRSLKIAQIYNLRGEKKKKMQSLLQVVFTKCYHYIQNNYVDGIRDELKTYSVIYLEDSNRMVRAGEVIIDLSDDEAVDGYIYKAPLFFGQFMGAFEKLGSSKKVTANHYAQVLESMYSNTKGKKLHPNELKTVQKAVCKLFECIQKNKDVCARSISVPCLYLPNQHAHLEDASKLVMIDNHHLNKRVKSLNLCYLIDFKRLELGRLNPVTDIVSLPERYRPQILSRLVKEHVTPECKEEARTGNVSRSILEHIQSPAFITGVIRLISDNMHPEGITDEKAKETETTLLKLEVLEVSDLKTFLSCSRKTVDGSINQRKWFYEKQFKEQSQLCGSYCIYLDKEYCQKFNTVYRDIARAINKILPSKIGRIDCLSEMLLISSASDISSLLDMEEIIPSNYKITKPATVFPSPGSLIPEEFHCMLDNNFDLLSVGEYVGLEVYDPVIEDRKGEPEKTSTTTESSNPVFIYAVVKEILEDNVYPMMVKYRVEVGEGRQEDILGAKLYKFIRDQSSVEVELVPSTSSATSEGVPTLDLETILKEIRQTLKEAWHSLEEPDRKRVIKRLYLRWHPDKNDPSMKDICTKVCQYIQLYMKKLNNGESIDNITEHNFSEEPPFKRRKYRHRRDDDSSFFDFMNTRSRSHRQHYKTYKEHKSHGQSSSFDFGSASDSFHSATRENAYPHRPEAKRWLRQAKADLDAAAKGLSNPSYNAFNWICFKSHQAAEKALKAMCYNENAGCTDRIRSHDLRSIARNLMDASSQLLSAVADLEILVVDFNRMRYPDRLSFPAIPSEVYSKETAQKAYELANIIVRHAEENIS
ncbi:sacsin-like [Gigantopelta aegis]|uniref:sacsin-like n=1 Tax=Gigantopelta aegis TaxID=1735272 RepID=UPI001B887859|nr:sacsin-like [Gigantopelta aegis]